MPPRIVLREKIQERRQRADKPTVAFDLLTAYGIAAAVILTLTVMGVRNRRAGMPRNRERNVLVGLLESAMPREVKPEEAPQPAAGLRPRTEMAADLATLHAAIQLHGQVPVAPESPQDRRPAAVLSTTTSVPEPRE